MLFLLILLAAYAGVRLFGARHRDRRDQWRLALGVAMAVAGVAHLVDPLPFVQHLPPWVPNRELLVAASGVAEIALGAGLLLRPPWRGWVGLALAAYLVAVFPANVYVAVSGVDVSGQPGGVYPWLRLPFQALFVWLAAWSTRAPSVLRVKEPV